jgi:hypothetical protein
VRYPDVSPARLLGKPEKLVNQNQMSAVIAAVFRVDPEAASVPVGADQLTTARLLAHTADIRLVQQATLADFRAALGTVLANARGGNRDRRGRSRSRR